MEHSVTDYGLDLTTMVQTNLLKLDRVQNEAMRVILGTTKDTPIETMRFMLDLPPLQTRQKVEQVKAYFSAIGNPHNPLHEAVKDTKGCRLGRDKSWMGQAEDSVPQVCQLTELKQTKERERYLNRFQSLYDRTKQDEGRLARGVPSEYSSETTQDWKQSFPLVQSIVTSS